MQREIEELRPEIPKRAAHAAGADGMTAPPGVVTPAMEKDLTDHVWSAEKIARLA